jgi:hypothetical protein
MPAWLLRVTFDFCLGAWCLMCGVGFSSDIKRWLDKRPKKPGKGVSQALRGLH